MQFEEQDVPGLVEVEDGYRLRWKVRRRRDRTIG
jgi:hypothetical protein